MAETLKNEEEEKKLNVFSPPLTITIIFKFTESNRANQAES